MGYDPNLLYGDEQIVLDTHPSWVMMTRSVLYVVGATVAGVLLLQLGGDGILGTVTNWAAFALIVLALLHLAHRLVAWYSTNFVVTTERCIYREGVISKKGIEIPLDRINTIFFHQRLVERLFGCGTLHIESAGELGIQRFKDVRDPLGVQNTIYQAMEDNQTRHYQRMGASAARAAPVAATPVPSVADELAKLASLHEAGHLTDAEFAQQKAVLLGTPVPPEPTVHQGGPEPTVQQGGPEPTVQQGGPEPTVQQGGPEPTVQQGGPEPTVQQPGFDVPGAGGPGEPHRPS